MDHHEIGGLMQNRISRPLLVIGTMVCFVSAVLAAPSTTNITLTGVAGPSLGGVYTSPYLGTVGNETNVAIICDDFTSETYFNESWTADVTNLATIPSDLLKWDGGYSWDGSTWTKSLDQSMAYTTAAYLATEILQASTATVQEDLSYALWGLFDAADPVGPFKGSYLQGTPDLTAAQQLLRDAESVVQNQHLTVADFSNVTIYSYDSSAGAPTCLGGSCPPPPQEFLRVSMAEPSYPAVLAVDLLAVLGLMVVLRRRIASLFN
jgi:hypothetical protein